MLRNYSGAEAERGGLDMVLSLTQDQRAALGADAVEIAEAVDTLLVAIAALRTGCDPSAMGSLKDRPVSAGLTWHEWVLRDTSYLLAKVEGVYRATVRRHAEDGGSYGQLAAATGVPRTTAQNRRDALLSATPEALEMWATGEHGPVDHPGVKVPASLKSWSYPWSAYTPVDITPPELLGKGLMRSAADGWAEPYPTPSDVPVAEMRQRAKEALVPFDLDDRAWPLNPQGRTGRTGRNLGKWGENAAADSIVLAGQQETGRSVLLIKRGDTGEWATPGGMAEENESELATMTRELLEETGVDLTGQKPLVVKRVYVSDWRNTDHAWICSTVGVFEVQEPIEAQGQDDAIEARWWPFTSLDELAREIAATGDRLSNAHLRLLSIADGGELVDGVMPGRLPRP